MASSLYLHCSTTTAASASAPPSPKPRHPLLSKPTHFLPHARRSPRLHVSASATPNDSDSPQGRVDRRNMLLGLGGMYGAAALIPTPAASANPVQAPELDKCGAATNLNTGAALDFSCCPPVTDTIVDYTLPAFPSLRTRKSAHRLSPVDVFKYNLAIQKMRELPDDDPRSFVQQAYIHCAYCNGAYNQPGQGDLDIQVHNSWLFFPFHRWYLYFYERILGSLIGDPTFSLPFWNWDNPKGMNIPPIFLDQNSAIYDDKRNQANLKAVVDLGMTGNTDPLQVVTNNLTVMYTEMVRGNADVYDFMGQPYREGTAVSPGPGSSERGSHTALHVFVGDPRQPSGEDMGNFYSAGRDPLFYCHHSNVDRMWTLWKDVLPSDKIPVKTITDPDFLNASFLFYDENAQLVRVFVKDCVDSRKLGYDYQRIDLPWMDYRPPVQTALARIKRTTSSAPKAATLFPLNLNRVVRFEVQKTKKGKADELLVLEDITVDTTKFLKFDVFVNDEDDNALELDKASYAGTYAQVPHKAPKKSATTTIRLKLTDLYEDMDIGDDDTIVVTIVPRHKGPGVTIGGIKIIENPPTPAKA